MNGWLGGGQIGYNYQVDRWVFGVEAEFSGSNLQGSGLCNVVGVNNCFDKVNWLTTVAGRVGFAVDHVLIYVKGGCGWAHDEYQTNIEGASGTFGAASENRGGGMFGTGLEYSITRNWSAKVEYDYLDLGTKSVAFSNSANAALSGLVPTTEQIHSLRLG